MSPPATELQGFAYGEQLSGSPPRSLGFRLLAPSAPQPWCDEVESLARRLQAAPYPDTWPATDLMCSVLLADGQRVVAVARYGLLDHTPSRRRGGLELIGVIAPGSLGVPTALAIYQWLRRRRQEVDDPRELGGRVLLADVLAAVPPEPARIDPVPVLPIRMWQEGVLLFAATSPDEPDHRLGLLEQGATSTWQWLPLVGTDFPLQTYAARGPVVAWTAHLAGVAVKLDRTPDERAAPSSSRRYGILTAIGLVLAALLGANLWAALSTRQAILSGSHTPVTEATPTTSPSSAEVADEAFARALYAVLQNPSARSSWNEDQLIGQYERLAALDPNLRQSTREGKLVVGAVGVLARRSPGHIETLIREALSNRGFDPELIEVACKRVHDHLAAGPAGAP